MRDADVGYYLLVDRFADGDPWNNESFDRQDAFAWHGGDLRGVLDHLDDLAELGVGRVWLSPIFEAGEVAPAGRGAFEGLAPSDLGRIEPRFGDLDLAVALGTAVRRRRMRFVLDVVFDRLAADSPLVAEHPDWFLPGDAGGAGLARLDLHRAEPYTYVVEQLLRWVSVLDPEALYLHDADAAPPATLAHLAADLRRLWPADRGEARLYGDPGGGSPAELARLRSATGLDAVVDHPLEAALHAVFCAGAEVGLLGAVLSADRADPGARTGLITRLDAPDGPRFGERCAAAGGGPVEHQQALAVLLASRGRPVLTWGTEWDARTGGAEGPGDMDWSGPRPFAATIREFSDARRQWPSLVDGETWVFDLQDGGTLGLARVLPDEASVLIVNRGAAQAMVRLPPELREGAALASFHEVDAAEGPFRRYQVVANPADGPRRVRPFFVVPGATVVAHLQPDRAGAWAGLVERLRAARGRDVPVRLRVPAPGRARPAVALGGPALDGGRVLPLRPAGGGAWESDLVGLPAGAVVGWQVVAAGSAPPAWDDPGWRWLLVPLGADEAVVLP